MLKGENMKRLFTTRATLLTGLILSACGGPSLSVSVLEPAEFNVSSATQLVLGDGLGRPLAKDLSAEILESLVAQDNYFSFAERTDLALDPINNTLNGTLAENAAIVRIDVAEFYIVESVENEVVTDEQGEELVIQTPTLEARVLLEVSLAHNDGTAIMNQVLYEGVASLNLNEVSQNAVVRDSEIYAAALEAALEPFLTDITPSVREHRIALDDSEEALHEAVQQANARSFDSAQRLFEAHLESKPESAAALYNLGVILDAQSRFESALEKYDAAIALSPKALYQTTLRDCLERITLRDAMR